MNGQRELLRHALATLAYRLGPMLRGYPDSYPSLSAGEGVRTPIEIVSHLGDLMEWALSIAVGRQSWPPPVERSWNQVVDRFYLALRRFDERLAESAPLAEPEERLFQGPVADALTHVGQLALLRRLSHSPVRGENYFLAEVRRGRVGVDQAKPKMPFGGGD